MHGGEVSVVVLRIEGAGVSSGPRREFQAAIQLVDRSGAAGGQSAVWDHHIFRCVVDPLFLWQTGWRRGCQGAVAMCAAV